MKKVLVVDDDQGVLRALNLVLKRNGFEPVLAASGAECLDHLREGFKGVVLMDVMMPGMTGWETIRAMVNEQLVEGVLICMLTAKPPPDIEAQGLEEYVFDYLPKPFQNAALIHCVENTLDFLPA